MFAVSGIMQAILLVICIAWKIRQRRLNIDDFGNPLPMPDSDSPVHFRQGSSSVPVQQAVETAIEEPVPDIEIVRAMLGEDTPLLKNGRRRSSSRKSSKGWFQSLRGSSG